MVGYMKLAAAAALSAVAKVNADSAVYVLDNDHLFTSAKMDNVQLSETDVSFLLAQLAGSATPLETKPPTGLPAADIFHKVNGTVALLLNGVEASPLEGAAASFSLLDSSATSRDAIHAMTTGNTVSKVAVPELFVSGEPLRNVASHTLTWTAQSNPLDAAAFEFLSSVGVHASSDANTVTHTASGVSFDLTDASTLQFLGELAYFNGLAAEKKNDLQSDRPSFALLSAAGPQKFKDVHANDDAANQAVDAIASAAASKILDSWSELYGDDAYEVAIFRSDATEAPTRRKLSSSSPTLYTSSETAEYQIFTWTWFLLVLIIFFSACSLGGVNIGKDDAGLYSTFKAGSYDRATHEHDQ